MFGRSFIDTDRSPAPADVHGHTVLRSKYEQPSAETRVRRAATAATHRPTARSCAVLTAAADVCRRLHVRVTCTPVYICIIRDVACVPVPV